MYAIRNEVQPLNWTLYPGLVRISTEMDGSCFFHAILKSFFLPYKTGFLDGKPLNRSTFAFDLRKSLSRKLGAPVEPNNPLSPTYYATLSRGKLAEISKDVPDLSLDYMQKELASRLPIDNKYNEFISNVLDKDIYLLDYNTKDVYITGADDEILYKNRPSIVILVLPGHYELIGLQTNSGVQTLFDPSSNFIQNIRFRSKILRHNRKSSQSS